jgi:hypothetical protein
VGVGDRGGTAGPAMAEAPATDAATLAEQQRLMEARFVSMVKVVLTGAWIAKGAAPSVRLWRAQTPVLSRAC